MNARAASAALLLAVAAAATPARAQTAAAEALFDEGRRLMGAGAYAQACPKFAESQRLDPAAGTLMNLATCEEYAGRLATAWATYRQAAAASERAGRAEWAKRARSKADTLEPRLSRLSISMAPDAREAGVVVTSDGVAVGEPELATAIPVDGGPHTIEASAPGKRAWRTTVEAPRSGGRLTVTVPRLEAAADASSLPSPAPPPPPTTAAQAPSAGGATPAAADATDASPGSGRRTAGYVLLGTGVAGIAVGAVFGLVTFSAASSHCNGGTACADADDLDARRAARTTAWVSDIGFAVGAVAAAAGVVLLVTRPAPSRSLRVRASAAGLTLEGPL